MTKVLELSDHEFRETMFNGSNGKVETGKNRWKCKQIKGKSKKVASILCIPPNIKYSLRLSAKHVLLLLAVQFDSCHKTSRLIYYMNWGKLPVVCDCDIMAIVTILHI